MIIAAIIGLLFGFIGSMPVAGPIAVLVFSRGVENRLRNGIGIAAGGAVAEAGYAFLAFWGFSTYLVSYPFIVPVSRGVAAAVLLTLGIAFVRRRPADPRQPTKKEGWGGGFLLGFSITALNPTLIATWAAATTTLFSTGFVELSPSMGVPFGIGAGVGVVGWFVLLLVLMRRYRGRFRAQTLTTILRITGVILIALGLWFLAALLSYLLAR